MIEFDSVLTYDKVLSFCYEAWINWRAWTSYISFGSISWSSMFYTLLTIFSLSFVILIDAELSFSGREGFWGGTKIGSEGKKVSSITMLSFGEEIFGVEEKH